jgi:cell division septation protein DedD
MTLLRTLLIILVLLNVLAFVALQGWLGTTTPPGEPERLTNQLNPERIKLRPYSQPKKGETTQPKPPPPSTAAAVTAEPAGSQPAAAAVNGSAEAQPVCVAYAALSPESARKLGEELAAQKSLTVKDVQVEAPSSWWVNVPPAGSREGADARVAELRQQGVTDLYVVHEAGPNQFAVSLGLFKQAAQAERLVEELQAKGVSEARVTPRGATHRIEISGPADRLAELAGELGRRYPGAGRQECRP